MKVFPPLIKKLAVILVAIFLMCLTSCSDTDTVESSENASASVTEAVSDTKSVSDTESDITESATEEITVARDIKPLSDVSNVRDNKYSCSYDGVSHDFILYLPEQSEGAPLVLMLHGYGESAERFRDTSHFHEEAVPEGYAVCYITGAANPYDSTSSNGWNSGIASDGNDDLSFLLSLTEYLRTEYKLSSDKLFAIGFSNGAFMIHRLAVEAGDVFTGLISVAGKMPEAIWADKDTGFYTSFFQVTGEKDNVVPLNSSGTAKYAKDPAIEDVIDFWAEKAGLDNKNEEEIGNGSILTKYSSGSGNIHIWNLLINDARHSWPDENINKININSYIIEFMNILSK